LLFDPIFPTSSSHNQLFKHRKSRLLVKLELYCKSKKIFLKSRAKIFYMQQNHYKQFNRLYLIK